MGGFFAGGAEVVGCAHQALAEVPLPDAVDHHPAGQRMVRPGQPLGQLPAPAALSDGRLPAAGQHHRELLGHRLARSLVTAADEHPLVDRFPLGHGGSQGWLRRGGLLQKLHLFSQFGDAVPGLLGQQPFPVLFLNPEGSAVLLGPLGLGRRTDHRVEKATLHGDELVKEVRFLAGGLALPDRLLHLLLPLPQALVPLSGQPVEEILVFPRHPGELGGLGPVPLLQVGTKGVARLQVFDPALQQLRVQILRVRHLLQGLALQVNTPGRQHVFGQKGIELFFEIPGDSCQHQRLDQ